MKWDSKLYDNAQAFVSKYGKSLITLLPDSKEQSILDLGCGTGDLTQQISETYENVIGVDSSPEMIDEAKLKYPSVRFAVCDACRLLFNEQFDVIFSNAVFHWIPNQEELLNSIHQSLKSGGKLICEFGGEQNISKISNAFAKAIDKFGDEYTNPFYFPNVDEHKHLVQDRGFYVEQIYDYDRPTPLPNGIVGLREWMSQFFSTTLQKYSAEQREVIFSAVETELRDDMFDGDKWVADYRRIRVVATKI